jgi:hypothetical protein
VGPRIYIISWLKAAEAGWSGEIEAGLTEADVKALVSRQTAITIVNAIIQIVAG